MSYWASNPTKKRLSYKIKTKKTKRQKTQNKQKIDKKRLRKHKK